MTKRILFILAGLACLCRPVNAILTINGVEMKETAAIYQSDIKFLTVPPAKQNDPDFNGNNIAKIKALETPIRREIYDKMEGSTETFAFDALTDAQQNFSMRLYAIGNMRDMNDGKIDYGYHNPYADPQVPVSVGSAKWSKGTPAFAFELNAGENAYDGIKDLLATKTRGECAGAITACIFGGASSVGKHAAANKAAFNALHPNGSLILAFRTEYKKHRYDATDTKTHVPGDYIYMKNKDNYSALMKAKKKSGFWQGENCLYVGKDDAGKETFAGLGVKDSTEDALRAELVKAYENDTGEKMTGNKTTEVRFTAVKRLQVK